MRRWAPVAVIVIVAGLAYRFLRDDDDQRATSASATTTLPAIPTRTIARATSAIDHGTTNTPSLWRPGAGTAPQLRDFKTQIRERLAKIDDAVHECAAMHATKKLSGRAMLYVIAGRDKQRVVSIESTGIVDDESTVKNEALLTCFHEAGRALGPLELDDAIDSALIHWRVELTAGEITDIHSSDYSFRKDTDDPLD